MAAVGVNRQRVKNKELLVTHSTYQVCVYGTGFCRVCLVDTEYPLGGTDAVSNTSNFWQVMQDTCVVVA